MTKKDYELLAAAVKTVAAMPEDEQMEGADFGDGAFDVAVAIAAALEKDNPRFNRERFLEACGYDEN